MAAGWLDGLEQEASQSLPPEVFAYFRQGARDGLTAADAVAAWRRLRVTPRVLRDVSVPEYAVRLLGTSLRLPVGVAPTTLQRAADPEGEVAMAAAVAEAGSLLVVSSNAGSTFEDIAATGVAWWLQAYLTQERDRCRPLLESAVAAGARAVVLTLDTPVVGTKYGASAQVWDRVEPGWLRTNLGAAADEPKARDLGPEDLAWLHSATGLPVVVKGVLDPGDARRCVEAGASAVWVSNHGGRQLDRVPATADCLAGVLAALAGEVPVLVDGGVRTGLDVLAALALGADGVFLGRQPLYALAVGGRGGVARLFTELEEELVEALRLAGCPDLAAVRELAVTGGRPGPDLHEWTV